jgi:hypothetical protein
MGRQMESDFNAKRAALESVLNNGAAKIGVASDGVGDAISSSLTSGAATLAAAISGALSSFSFPPMPAYAGVPQAGKPRAKPPPDTGAQLVSYAGR